MLLIKIDSIDESVCKPDFKNFQNRKKMIPHKTQPCYELQKNHQDKKDLEGN
jgi:hypothetical protein